MPHQTGSFQSSDGLKIFTESWLPDGQVKAVVFIVHGLAEHIGRYAHVAERMNAGGYAVYGLDHRGHGKSDGLRAYFENFNQPVNDLKTAFDQAKTKHPGAKIFIYGHSLGSLLTLTWLLQNQSEVAGAIISGTTLDVESSQPKALLRLADIFNQIAPRMAITPLDSKWISRDPEEVRKYDTDPLVHRGNVRVRMGYQLVHGSRDVKARLADLKMPILIAHGGDDHICPPSGAPILHQGIGSPDKTLKVYDGMYHEVHNEIGREAVLNDYVGWLDQHSQ